MSDLISIVVTSYNYQAFIGQTLESILAQSFPNWEALIIDDGSTDDSLMVIKSFCEKDTRFKLLQHEGGGNRGLSESLQLGIGHASGDWVAFCESDDWWAPFFLETVCSSARDNPQAGVVFTDVILEGRSESMEAHCRIVREHFRQGKTAIDLYLGMRNAVPTFSCAMVKAGLVRGCNFRSHFAPSLDMWLWAQLVNKTEFEYVDKPLCHWRQHDKSYMKKEVDPAALDMQRVLEFHDQIRGLFRNGKRQKAAGFVVNRSESLFYKLKIRIGSFIRRVRF